MLQIVVVLTDDTSGVIYNRNIFILQATDIQIIWHCQLLGT